MPDKIYFTGSDGSGKTTYINRVTEYLQSKGYTVRYQWMRSPKLLSKPLMLYCRIMGYTRYFYVSGVKYGTHDFHKSRFVSYLYPYIQFVDFYILYRLNKWKMRKEKFNYLLLDRHAIDTLADLMIDTKRMDMHKTRIGRAFISLVPKDAVIIPLYVEGEIVKQRKIDTLHDPNLHVRVQVYSTLFKSLNLSLFNNSYDDPEIVFKKILKSITCREAEHERFQG